VLRAAVTSARVDAEARVEARDHLAKARNVTVDEGPHGRDVQNSHSRGRARRRREALVEGREEREHHRLGLAAARRRRDEERARRAERVEDCALDQRRRHRPRDEPAEGAGHRTCVARITPSH
jgi:hypothetical protein